MIPLSRNLVGGIRLMGVSIRKHHQCLHPGQIHVYGEYVSKDGRMDERTDNLGRTDRRINRRITSREIFVLNLCVRTFVFPYIECHTLSTFGSDLIFGLKVFNAKVIAFPVKVR